MIIIDFSQLMISSILSEFSKEKINTDIVRHIAMNMIRHYSFKHKKDFGNIVIACDGKNSWRKEVFPYYKAHRKADRAKMTVDWSTVFECISQIYQEISDDLPYPIIKVDRAEGDDVIAVLSRIPEESLIISSDEDFLQLQNPIHSWRTHQYSPKTKKFLKSNDVYKTLKEHIILGDRGDGIPNILSPDDCFVNKIRQTTIRQTKLDELMNTSLEYHPNQTIARNYARNDLLINLSNTPEELKEEIMAQYQEKSKPDGFSKMKRTVYGYLVKHNLRNLLEKSDQF